MNLIITCPRHFENETLEEIKGILNEMGDTNPIILITEMPGILTISTKINELEVIKNIQEKILDEPWRIRYCLRIIPIQSTVTTNLEDIRKEIRKLIGVINSDETYRITIEKRNFNISKNEIIKEIANYLTNKVSLEDPDWIILIEIIGNTTGLAVLRKESIVSVEKMKRSISS